VREGAGGGDGGGEPRLLDMELPVRKQTIVFERACRICVFEKVAAVWRANVFCRRPFAGPDAKPRETKLLSMTPALQVFEPPSVAQHNEAHSRSAHDFKGVVVLVCHRFF